MSKRLADFYKLVCVHRPPPGLQIVIGGIRAIDDAVIHDLPGRVVERTHPTDTITGGYEDRRGWQLWPRRVRNDRRRTLGR